MSPMRGYVKETFFLRPLREEMSVVFASSPISDLERLFVRDVLLTDQGNRLCLLDGFILRWFDAFGPEDT